MRRIIYIVLAVIVVILVGFFCWREFLVPDLNYVVDSIQSDTEHHLRVQRLYAADVNYDAYNKKLEDIINTTEYTEEEKLAAAIASGKPEFFPAFNLGIYNEGEEIRLDGVIEVELAEKQKEQRFKFGKISLEVIVTDGDLAIDRVDVSYPEKNKDDTIVKINSENAKQAAVDISSSSSFRVVMDGESGTLLLRFVYSIEADTFLPRKVLEEQLLEIQAAITPGSGVNLDIDYQVSDYTSLEEING